MPLDEPSRKKVLTVQFFSMPDTEMIFLISGGEVVYKNEKFRRRSIPKGGCGIASYSMDQRLPPWDSSCSTEGFPRSMDGPYATVGLPLLAGAQ